MASKRQTLEEYVLKKIEYLEDQVEHCGVDLSDCPCHDKMDDDRIMLDNLLEEFEATQ